MFLVTLALGALYVPAGYAGTDCQEGCTPGYWKNHTDSWVGFLPGYYFGDVFGVGPDPDITLLDALKAKGGGENAMIRHAVAALLNATHPDVYSWGVSALITFVQEAYSDGNFEVRKNYLEKYNELVCPLD